MQGRPGQRSLLRPHRPDDGDQPVAEFPEIRAPHPLALGRAADRLHELNYHRDHFGLAWNLRTTREEMAHTGCVAFGIDRLALALFATHGLDLPRWPAAVRKALML